MAQITHDISSPDDGLGDALRTAFDNQNDMNTELYDTKVDKITGKGLSENDFTDADKAKLDGLNNVTPVQADLGQTDNLEPDFVLNKNTSNLVNDGEDGSNPFSTFKVYANYAALNADQAAQNTYSDYRVTDATAFGLVSGADPITVKWLGTSLGTTSDYRVEYTQTVRATFLGAYTDTYYLNTDNHTAPTVAKTTTNLNDGLTVWDSEDGDVSKRLNYETIFKDNIHLAYGTSYEGNFRERMLNLGATYFPNEAAYRVALHRYLGVEPSLLLVPSATAVSNVYMQLPKDPLLSLKSTRASTATDIDEWGERVSKAINEPRVSYLEGFPCFLAENTASTNLFLNSGIGQTLVTQNVTTSATTYTVSFYGTGTITFSGTYAGSLVGTGSNPKNRVSLTFTATAGTLTCTVSGSVVEAQIEALGYMSSFIPTTGATATRSAETFIGAGNSATFNSSEGVLIARVKAYENGASAARRITVSDGTANNRFSISLETTAGRVRSQVVAGGAAVAAPQVDTMPQNVWNTVGITFKLNQFDLWVNGVKENVTDISGAIPTGLNTLRLDIGYTAANNFNGKIRFIEYLKAIPSDDIMAKLTSNS